MFQHIKDLVELDDSGPKAWKLLRDPVLDKIKDTYGRMAAAGSNVSQIQQCTKIISVLDKLWDNLIPTLNTQQDQWTPEWLRQQILQEDFRRRHTGGGAANKTAEGYGAAGGSRGRGGGRGQGPGRIFEEKNSCIKDLWLLPIIPWNGKPPATAAAAATAKATAGGEETVPTDGALDAVKKVQQTQQPHGEVLAGVDATAAWAKASSGSGEADYETWHERLCHVNFPMLQNSSSSPFTTTPLIIEDDEVQRPSRQVQVTVSEEEISGVTEDGGEPEVEEQQQQQDAPPQTQHPRDRPRRDVPPPNRLTYPSFGKPKVVRNWSVAEKCDEDEIAHCYWEADFDEIFAPMGKGTTLRVMLRMAANRGWRIKQMDITTAFLNGIILEELYMLQPEGLDDGSNRVCKLKKAIYGLKHGPRAWYHKLEETLLAGGFKKSECDHSLFLLQEKEQFLMLLVYVDDTRLFSESSAMIERVEETLEMQFKCSKMGDVKYYLGMHVERDLDKGVWMLHQRKY
ncbi:unnamed protein product [Closterium sp. NIES-53]